MHVSRRDWMKFAGTMSIGLMVILGWHMPVRGDSLNTNVIRLDGNHRQLFWMIHLSPAETTWYAHFIRGKSVLSRYLWEINRGKDRSLLCRSYSIHKRETSFRCGT